MSNCSPYAETLSNEIYSSVAIIPAGKTQRSDQPALLRVIIAAVEAFQEAFELQDAARKRFRLDE
jgi:hypothetical protein